MPSRLIRNAEDLDIWYPAIGYEDLIEITELGRVRRVGRNELKPFDYNGGYLAVQVRVEGKRRNLLLHRLLADAFIPNPHGKPFINHIDGNKANNDLANLEWVTHAENMAHAYRTGLAKARDNGPGERSPAAKLNWDQVRHIRALLAHGASQQSVADLFGVRQGTIGFIARNETWRVLA
jgi:hypothetical protein